MRKGFLIAVFLVLLLPFAENPVENIDIIGQGLGNSSVAYGYSVNSFFLNPANISFHDKGAFSVFMPLFSFNEEANDLLDYYLDNKTRFEDEDFDPMDDLEWEEIEDVLSKDPYVAAAVPLNFMFISPKDKLGIHTLFGLNVLLRLNADITRGVIPPVSSYVSADVTGDIFIPFGIARDFKISKYNLKTGILLKYAHREKIFVERSLAPELINYVPVKYSGDGFGADAGIIFEYSDQLNFGLSFQNIGGMRFTWTADKLDDGDTRTVTIDRAPTFIEPDMNIGMTFFPRINGLPSFIDNNFINLSVNAIFPSGDHFMNHVKIGLGTRILKVFNIFFGLNGGYPSFATDIDLWAAHFSYAFYTIERGKFPGDIPDSRHVFGLSFSSNARPPVREARWRKTAEKEKKKKKENPAEIKDAEENRKLEEQKIKLAQEEALKKREEELKKEEDLRKKSEAEEKVRQEEAQRKKEALEKLQNEAKHEIEKGKETETPVVTPTAPETVPRTAVSPEERVIEERTLKEEVMEEKKIEKKEIPPAVLKERAYKIVLNIRFAPGKTELPEEARSELFTVLSGLKNLKELKITVNSFTDSSGSAEINLKLSELRAQEVRKFFIQNGVPPEDIIAKGLGAADPVADNSTPEGRAKNRRIELGIKGKE
mgnify:CR=1 FL=1